MSLKKLVKWLIIATTLALVGCGGGGEVQVAATPATLTPIGTPVNLVSFKNVFYGKDAGTQYYFNLSGKDSHGNLWTGIYTAVADGEYYYPDTPEVKYTKSRSLLSLYPANGSPTTSTSVKFFKVSDGNIYMIDSLTYVHALSTAPLPNNPKIGDFGNLGSISDSTDGGSTVRMMLTVRWQLDAGFNGSSKLVFNSEMFNRGSTTKELDTFTLDANGTPTNIILTNAYGETINLSGKKE
jgi:hypothetical protein